ncbi:hypothetical protein [Microbacterium sp. 16-032]|uniref:hypothetical protein n=1 Tax=Microbacterium sp. 16-032 TaxID=3239808 RepID=UPI0034E23A1B
MSVELRGKYESGAPTAHTRVEVDVWAMDCIYDECEHGVDPDEERPSDKCPSSKAVVCEECSEWNSEHEGGVEPWPCENQAVQDWQAAGGEERQYEVMVEAFFRGWSEHERRERLHAAMTISNAQGRENRTTS